MWQSLIDVASVCSPLSGRGGGGGVRRGGASVSVSGGVGVGVGRAVAAVAVAVAAAAARPRPGAGLTFVRAPPAPRAWYFSTRRRAGAAAEPRDGRAPAAALTSPPAPSAGAASPAGKDKRAAADEPRPPPRQHEQRRDGQVQHLPRRGQQQLQLQQQRLQLPLPHQAGCHEEVRGRSAEPGTRRCRGSVGNPYGNTGIAAAGDGRNAARAGTVGRWGGSFGVTPSVFPFPFEMDGNADREVYASCP